MAKQSPHVAWKGCRLCKPHKDRRAGQAVRQPWSVLRQVGRRRRVSRHALPLGE